MTVESLRKANEPTFDNLDQAVAELVAAKDRWARTSIQERLAVLAAIRPCLMSVAEDWALTAARAKQIPDNSPLVGEEWLSGPYTLMSGCDALAQTLREMDGKRFLKRAPVRDLPTGQIAAKVFPQSIWDRLLLSGVSADVWMQPGVTRANLAANTAGAYDAPAARRTGKVALVLGAGNIAAIAPLDCFQKIFVEHQVTLLKLNPVNDYLDPFLQAALKPLIDADALRIVRGGADVGAYLCDHAGIDEIHITGSQASHDAIVWGQGDAGRDAKSKGTPRNARRITSELGAVCPTIVVPGPWSAADIAFQAEHVASQKLHNSGFNCIACQMLVVSNGWDKTDPLLAKIDATMKAAPPRGLYYPGAAQRMADFSKRGQATTLERAGRACLHRHPVRQEQRSRARDAGGVRAGDQRASPRRGRPRGLFARGDRLRQRSALRHARGQRADPPLDDPPHRAAEVRRDPRRAALRLHRRQRLDGARLPDQSDAVGRLSRPHAGRRAQRHRCRPQQLHVRQARNGRSSRRRSGRSRAMCSAAASPCCPGPPWFVTNRKQHVVGRLLTAFQYKPSWAKLPAHLHQCAARVTIVIPERAEGESPEPRSRRAYRRVECVAWVPGSAAPPRNDID